MIIDCHGHYTTASPKLQSYRDVQIVHFQDPTKPPPKLEAVSDDEIRESIEQNQLKALRERGADMTIFSPKASAMAHHIGDEAVSRAWTTINNDLIHRVTQLFPDEFIGVCQLPQSVGVPVSNSIEELERCVLELDCVGCNLNPDPSGGMWTGPPLTDRSWYPFFEKMTELDVPAMIHVSGSCNPNFHATGAHYINADTTAFMQFLQGDLFNDFPDLRLIIPHGGGAVDIENILFASEMFGAVKGVDPETGHNFDDTKRYVDALALSKDDQHKVFEGNARRVFPRLDAALNAKGR